MAAVVQVFSNALGCSNVKTRKINGEFYFLPIYPIGSSINYGEFAWSYHMVGSLNEKVFDACIKFDLLNPRIPVNEDVNGSYKVDLFKSGKWDPKPESRITNVY